MIGQARPKAYGDHELEQVNPNRVEEGGRDEDSDSFSLDGDFISRAAPRRRRPLSRLVLICIGATALLALIIGLGVGLTAQKDNAGAVGGGGASNPPSSTEGPTTAAFQAVNAFRMTAKDRQSAQTLFSQIDSAGSGSVSKEGVLARVGGLGLNLTQADLDLLFGKMDVDQNGSVDFDEFLDFLLIGEEVAFPGEIDMEVDRYQYLRYIDIKGRLQQLKSEYGDLVQIYTAQQRFDLPSVGTCNIGTEACEIWVMEITNPATYTAATPEVFYSGTIHGNERVGPTAVTEFATMLLKGYKAGNRWAKRLVDTRKLVVMPCGNAVGYDRNTREENGIDPNRDFAWDQVATQCMVTVAARAINEVYREHLFQLSTTFHGGTNLVAYPWGDTIRCQKTGGYLCHSGWFAPDNTGMDVLTKTLREFVGGFSGQAKYVTGALNDPNVIYPVNGGMEDWAYGASWATPGPVVCQPRSSGAAGVYAPEKTQYGNSTHRAVNLLVETADMKEPYASTLGSPSQVLSGGGEGHIPRNIRLCWFLLDVVQPYIDILNADKVPTSIPEGGVFHVTWRPGGSFTADTTQLVCVDSVSGAVACEAEAMPQGLRIWSEAGEAHAPITTAVTMLPVGAGGGQRTVRIRVQMTVDGGFASPERVEQKVYNKGDPMTHFVRARTDDSWYAANNGHVVQGRKVWASQELRVVVTKNTLRGGRRA